MNPKKKQNAEHNKLVTSTQRKWTIKYTHFGR